MIHLSTFIHLIDGINVHDHVIDIKNIQIEIISYYVRFFYDHVNNYRIPYTLCLFNHEVKFLGENAKFW